MSDVWKKAPSWVFVNQNTFLYSTYFGFIVAKAIRESVNWNEEKALLSDSVIKFLSSKSTTNREWKKLSDSMKRDDFKNIEKFFKDDNTRKAILSQMTEEWMNAIWDFDYFMEFILEELTKLELELIFESTKWWVERKL